MIPYLWSQFQTSTFLENVSSRTATFSDVYDCIAVYIQLVRQCDTLSMPQLQLDYF
jgi:hypothetical protein